MFEVTVTAEDQTNISLPNGRLLATGESTVLTPEQFYRLTPQALDLFDFEAMVGQVEVIESNP